VVDAIDSVKAKAAMIAWCRQHAIPLVIIGSAGGQTDPTQIAVRDLAQDRAGAAAEKSAQGVAQPVRLPARRENQVPCRRGVFDGAAEVPETGEVCAVDGDDRSGGVTGLNCAGFGSAMVVTATFGMVAASHVLRKLADSAQAKVAPGATSSFYPVRDTGLLSWCALHGRRAVQRPHRKNKTMMRSSVLVAMLCALAASVAQAQTPAARHRKRHRPPRRPPRQPRTVVVGSATPGPAAEQLIVIDNKVGTGKEATTGATVYMHYSGWLYRPLAKNMHGKLFDSSIRAASRSISCWAPAASSRAGTRASRA
jgi:hypothetical protein